MSDHDELGGRAYFPVYRVSGRTNAHDFLVDAFHRSGGRVMFASPPTRAPVYFGVQAANDERLGVLCYPFRCNPPPIRGRAPDEHRVQIRYGSEEGWTSGDHAIAHDIAGVDTTLVLGVHLEAGLIIGLDPRLYDPLPMGISVEFKEESVQAAQRSGWEVWERVNVPGSRRRKPRARDGIETLVAFRPERLLDYVRLERRATGLGLDPPLRFRAAEAAYGLREEPGDGIHVLEEQFELSSLEILEIIASRSRLAVAVKGGVAEHHLERHLRTDPAVVHAEQIDEDGRPDFEVELTDGRSVLVECKNVSPRPYADGTPKVEVQKTRSQRDDPAGRFYTSDQFDVVAACMFPVSDRWEFRFKSSEALVRHERWPERIAPIQRVDASWSTRLHDALGVA